MAGGEVRVRVTPRASADEIAGERDGVLLIRVSAPPVDSKANAAACRLLARCLGVRAAKVTVVRGERSREKTLRYEGVEQTQAQRRLREHLAQLDGPPEPATP